jgi:hypothetical protein
MGTGSFPVVKQSGHGVDHPPHLASRLNREELYIYSPPPWAFVAFSRVNIPYYIRIN